MDIILERLQKEYKIIDSETFTMLLKVKKKEPEINGVEFHIENMSFWFVKNDLPNLIKDLKLSELLKKCYLCSDKDLEIIDLNILIGGISYVLSQLQMTNKLEEFKLQSIPDPELIQAGISNLDQLGLDNIIDSLAGGDVTKWEKVKNTKYEYCLKKLIKSNIEAVISKNLANIRANNLKNKKK